LTFYKKLIYNTYVIIKNINMSIDKIDKNYSLENRETDFSLEEKIDNLEKNISNEYNISINNLKEISSFKTEKSLEELKSELKQIDWIREWTDYTLLAEKVLKLNKLKESITTSTIKEKEWLKSEVINDAVSFDIKKEDLLIWNYFSKEIIERCNNPKSAKDHIIWIFVWTSESVAVLSKLLYDVVKDWIKLPIDLYNIARWKAKYDWFKNL